MSTRNLCVRIHRAKLRHQHDDVRKFYEQFSGEVIVAFEASGYSAWFQQMLAELRHTIWTDNQILEAAAIDIESRDYSVTKFLGPLRRFLTVNASEIATFQDFASRGNKLRR